VAQRPTQGFTPEELEGQAAGLLPERVEMRRPRRRRRNFGFQGDNDGGNNNNATFVQINSISDDFEPGGTSFSS
jgi:hypothetical protein